jgi:hypothetical protein
MPGTPLLMTFPVTPTSHTLAITWRAAATPQSGRR